MTPESNKMQKSTVLLPRYEQSPLLNGQEAICYATFFTGTPPTAFLRERTEQIVALNPVLRGRLKRTVRGIAVEIPAAAGSIHINDHFVVQETLVTTETNPLGPALPVLVPSNRFAVNGKTPLFVVAVLRNQLVNQFCVVIAVSHLIADGATFYNLLGMLDKRSHPYALTFNLELDNSNKLGIRRGESDSQPESDLYRHSSLEEMATGAGNAYNLSKSWIDKEKQSAMADKPSPDAFVSTNDCLVSWFLKTTKVEYAAMYLNLRGKVPQLSANHAGNYMRPVVFQRGEFESPWQIREAISGDFYGSSVMKSGQQYRAPKLKSQLGIVSNVCGLFKQLELPGDCQFLEHHYTLRNHAIGVGSPYCTAYTSKPGQVCILTNIAFDETTFL
ncbi:hypothetical protein BDR26DRAFT_1006158 [Obelidium mucronatum]|nr:hypothetical protein BDR26DRAFT_1006158 [Obelidium mucronatum]